MDREDIMTSVVGPCAKPGRRFAVWALREHSLMKHKEIAEFMNMTQAQVSNVLSRFKIGDDPTLVEWGKEMKLLCDK